MDYQFIKSSPEAETDHERDHCARTLDVPLGAAVDDAVQLELVCAENGVAVGGDLSREEGGGKRVTKPRMIQLAPSHLTAAHGIARRAGPGQPLALHISQPVPGVKAVPIN